MTAQRQERNRGRPNIHFRLGMALIAVLAGLPFIGFGMPGGAGFSAYAATTERIVTNRYSGLAIEGYDPVAYFVDARPMLGRPDWEVAEAGAVWRFRNEGNRASFIAHPDIYGPQFGGYDPTDLARGVAVAGNPRFWLVAGERLYLFGREQHRDAFAKDLQHILHEATARWHELEQDLAR
jgi:hypothetical protein